jgi:hypothetical protein
MQGATVNRSLRIGLTDFARRQQRAGGGARDRTPDHKKWARSSGHYRRSTDTSAIPEVARPTPANTPTHRAHRIDSA